MDRRGHRHHAVTNAAVAGVVAVASLLVLAGCLPSGTRGTGTRDPGGALSSSPAATPAGSRGPSSTPSFVPPTPTPAPTFAVYTVAKGDNLNSIARKYATTARSLAFWNRGTYPSLDPDAAGYAPNRLGVGWTLRLVPGLVYDEETGDPVLPSGAVPAP
jgi:Tfp pilus assembly protein FimV